MSAQKPRPRRYRWLDGMVTYNGLAVANGAKPLSDSAIRVAMLLGLLYAQPDGSGVRVSQATIAAQLGTPLRTVEDSMRALRDAGVIVQTKGHNRNSPAEYQLVMTPVMLGYGADELTPVPTDSRGYEPVDNSPYPRIEDPVPTDRRSRTHGSPSREQGNRKNRGESVGSDELASSPTPATSDVINFATERHRRRDPVAAPEVELTDWLIANPEPFDHCHRHDTNHDEPCRGCAQQREAWQLWQLEHDARRAQADLVATAPLPAHPHTGECCPLPAANRVHRTAATS